MVRCAACATESADDGRFCPGCGAPLTAPAAAAASALGTRTAAQPPPASPAGDSDAFGHGRFLPGSILAGRYRIYGLLGRGGMGEVYRADDLRLGQVVALKFLPAVVEEDPGRLARFINEVKLARQISHPNVCRVYDVVELGRHHFLSMEYVDGEDLEALLRRIGRLPKDKAVQIARQICGGLAAAHEQGVLHRDLKPSNVMLDGRGRARITDFGLAVSAGAVGDDGSAGTPAYMSPEQLQGAPASVRSDLYALGLLLYEIFTGKPAFRAAGRAERPTQPSKHHDDIDPAVERVILRCLEAEPGDRPASALLVAAALPGGDPLAAAIAAGETPSPELVAEAGVAGGLGAGAVAGCLLAVGLGLVLSIALSGKVQLGGIVPLPKPPEVLAERAREVIARFGPAAPAVDSMGRFDAALDLVADRSARLAPAAFWRRLESDRPAAIYFWYRQSPDYMQPHGRLIGSYDDPTPLVPGAVRLMLEPDGALRAYEAIPPERVETQAAASPSDWKPLFEEARLDPSRFRATEPAWTPSVYADSRAAWESIDADTGEAPLRLEAAAWNGRLVFFRTVGASDRPATPESNLPGLAQRLWRFLLGLIIIAVPIGAAVLARGNLRRGRGDRRGAMTLAIAFLIGLSCEAILKAHHIPTLSEIDNVVRGFSSSLFLAGLVWVAYLAIEPYVRRLWPEALVSWVRLLHGRFGDPLVGRDLLLGVVFGFGFALLSQSWWFASRWFGLPVPPFDVPPFWLEFENLSGTRFALGNLFELMAASPFFSLVYLVSLLLLRLLLRSQRAAVLVFIVLWTLLLSLRAPSPLVAVPFAVISIAALSGCFVRFGLLTLLVGGFVHGLLVLYPLTTDLATWRLSGSILVVGLIGALAAYSARVALAGRQFLRDAGFDRVATVVALLATLGLLGTAPSVAAPPSTPVPAPALEPGRRVEVDLSPGTPAHFDLALEAGQRVKIIVTQIGIDVTLALRGPDGALVAEVDDRSSGDEVLIAIALQRGHYRLEAAAASDRFPEGRDAMAVELLPGTDDVRAAVQHHLDGQSAAARGRESIRDARREFEAARDAWARAGDAPMTAWSAHQVGALSNLIPEPVAARLAYLDAARRFDELGRVADQAAALYGAGQALHRQGDYPGACALWKTVFPMEGSLTPADRVVLRYDYGTDLKEQGDYDGALAAIETALVEFRRLGMLSDELGALAEAGSVHLMRRDTVRALDTLTAGMLRSREANRPEMEARFLHRLALVDWDIGDRESAARQAEQALDLYRQVGNHVAEASVLLLLGDCLGRRDDLPGAEANYRTALDLLRAAGSQAGEARALSRLGLLLSKRGEFAGATGYLERALEINRKQGNRRGEVSASLNLGRTRAAAGDRPEARRILNQALTLTRTDGAHFAEEDILGELALLDIDEGAFDRGLAALDQVLAIVESRQRAALVPALQAAVTSDAWKWYAARTDLMMRRHQAEPRAGWDARALESAERARARSLLGVLAESRLDLREGVEPERLARYREAQVRLAAATTDAAIVEATQGVQVIEAEIRKANPAYAALTLPVPLTLDAIRKRLLDDDTVLLEYAPGEKRGWWFAVSKEGLLTAPLPGAEEIRAAAERLYAVLSARPDGAAPAGSAGEAVALGGMLFGPIADRLAGAWRDRRLVIVPSPDLASIPFAVLPSPGQKGSAASVPLIEQHEIVALPSATVLDSLRRATGRRPAAARRIALIGDPVFSADDPRVAAGRPGTTATAARDAAPSPAPAGGATGYPRLPFSREEVRSIAALLPEGEAMQAIDFGARRTLATDGSLDGYRIVHFATHGLLDTAYPERSGLVLSLVDEAGRSQDGFLRLQEIYNLKLSADLVVLSACRTALGQRLAGEGLIGLTRGFMHAGAPRVVASLWQVDDSATAALMTRFYRGILQDGLRPAAALRLAQNDLRRDPRWAAPFYWAGFTLEGEWR